MDGEELSALGALSGECAAIVAVRKDVEQFLRRQSSSRRPAPVLLLGETGTGKGLLARAMHGAGPRRRGPFVEINCAAIPETLLETELFGYERGAFTDAKVAKPGLFQAAHRGTLFLDEIGLLPEYLQGKLLKALEDQAVRRLGSTRAEPVDVWILAATSEDLLARARERRFRPDLYHRLAVFTISLPPLHERGNDIILLAERFLAQACTDYGYAPKRLAADARAALLSYPWPGNVRELGNVIERACVLSEQTVLTREMLGLSTPAAPVPAERPPAAHATAVDDVVRAHMLEVLESTRWNLARSAALLKISRNTLSARIARYGLQVPASASSRRSRRPVRLAGPDTPRRAEVPDTTPVAAERRRVAGLKTSLAAGGDDLPDARVLGVAEAKLELGGGRLFGSGRSTIELKRVTVAFADVVDSIAIAQQLGPDAWHSLFRGCYDRLISAVRRYGGTAYFTGDGVMALFGADVTQEDHAERAVRATLTMRSSVQDYGHAIEQKLGVSLALRYGVHTGTVVVGRVYAELNNLNAMGGTVHLAARLQGVAAPEAIVISEATRRLLDDSFELRELGALALQGFRETTAAYEVVGARTARPGVRSRRAQRFSRLVGRAPELKRFSEEWRAVREGRGRVISVFGEAGIGKSHFLQEAKGLLAADGASCFEGTCSAQWESTPYLPFRQILTAMFGLGDEVAADDARRLIENCIMSLGLDPANIKPYVCSVLAYASEGDLPPELSPEAARLQAVDAIRDVLIAEATRHPIAIVVEDAHWMDGATEDVIAAIVEVLAEHSLLLVLAYRQLPVSRSPRAPMLSGRRDEHAPSASSALLLRAVLGKPYAVSLPLEPLSREASSLIVHEILGAATLPSEIEERVVSRSGGNPLFVAELTRSLLATGHVVPAGGRYAWVGRPENPELPTQLRDALFVRIDALREDLRHVLQVAAVVGPDFSRGVLAGALSDEIDLDGALLELEELGLIATVKLYPAREYSFAHVLMQEAVYSSLTQASRRYYHGLIAGVAERLYRERLAEYCELLAYHYVRSEHSDKALAYLDMSNMKATRLNAMVEARAYFKDAMRMLSLLPSTREYQRQRIFLLIRQANVMIFVFNVQEYHELLRQFEAEALALDDTRYLGPFLSCVGWCEWAKGDLAKAIETEKRAAAMCRAAGALEQAGLAHVAQQWSHFYRGEYREALELKAIVLQALQAKPKLRWFAWTHAAASLSWACLGEWERAVAEARRSLDEGMKLHDYSAVAFSAFTLSYGLTGAGDLKGARESGELAVKSAPTPADRAWARAFLALTRCRSGEAREAAAELASLEPQLDASGMVPPTELIRCFLGEAYWRAGDPARARETLQRCLPAAERAGMRFQVGVALRLLGEITLEGDAGEPGAPAGRAYLERSTRVLEEIGARHELALAYAALGRFHRGLGQAAEAARYHELAVGLHGGADAGGPAPGGCRQVKA
jgi:DNA-binding NtrC family response regulator/class 3 adenylate cyclase/tetratricopeptide (TPR) repeat protein